MIQIRITIASLALVAALAATALAGEALNALWYCRAAAAKTFALSSSEPAATVAQAAIGYCLRKEPAARREIVTSSGIFTPREAQEMLDKNKESLLISVIMDARLRRDAAPEKATRPTR
jgi:hypothetical protein